MGLAHTSLTIQNKYSSPASLLGGARGNSIFVCVCCYLTKTSCTAPSGNLDATNAFLRMREHAELLFRLLEPDDLWTKYGMISDVKVS